ncbi:hypothetical protein L210DRAFT_2159966 [Boletus edulis BED1]|uniref:SH3 domain-containing protein n=1 Tax=Boletus edulis BED1 TaxID=1328754 RepID=A0AAD4BUV5_BOLED|nr:hypothetical protein L210DRAFT_2159966 [Boletus edulis BED1]
MAPRIFSRQEQSADTDNRTAGGLIVGIFVIFMLLCLLCLLRFQRIRANRKRSAIPFHVGGFVRPTTTQVYPYSGLSAPLFSRDKLTASIIMPEKSITRKPHACGLSDMAGVLPKLTPSPTSSTPLLHRPLPNVASPRPRVLSILNPAHPRHSRSSSAFSGYTQYRLPPGLSPRHSLFRSVSPSQARIVQQPFEPTLPDELSLQCGEHLSVLQSFDDGWCAVARDTSRRSLLFVGVKNNEDTIDIGLVPTWVFFKPLEGVASTRPSRSTSLNALLLGQIPATRDMIPSWSNFA